MLGGISTNVGSKQQYFYRNKLEFSFTDNKWLTQEQLESGKEFPERRGAGFHIPGFWDKVLDIDACHLQPDQAMRSATLCVIGL